MKPLPTLVTTVLAMALIWFSVIGPPSAAVKPGPTVTPPPAELASKAAPIGAALAGASMADRLVWAEVWEKAGKAAAGETPDGEPIFTTTRGMRAFTVAALDVAWRRVQGVQRCAVVASLQAGAASATSTAALQLVDKCRAMINSAPRVSARSSHSCPPRADE